MFAFAPLAFAVPISDIVRWAASLCAPFWRCPPSAALKSCTRAEGASAVRRSNRLAKGMLAPTPSTDRTGSAATTRPPAPPAAWVLAMPATPPALVSS